MPARIVNDVVKRPKPSVVVWAWRGVVQPTGNGYPKKLMVGAPAVSLHSDNEPWEFGTNPEPVTVTPWPFVRFVSGATRNDGPRPGAGPTELGLGAAGEVGASEPGATPAAGACPADDPAELPDVPGPGGADDARTGGEGGAGADGSVGDRGAGATSAGAGVAPCGEDDGVGGVGASVGTEGASGDTPESGDDPGAGAIPPSGVREAITCRSAFVTWTADGPGDRRDEEIDAGVPAPNVGTRIECGIVADPPVAPAMPAKAGDAATANTAIKKLTLASTRLDLVTPRLIRRFSVAYSEAARPGGSVAVARSGADPIGERKGTRSLSDRDNCGFVKTV